MLLTRQAIQKANKEERKMELLEQNRLKILSYTTKGLKPPFDLINEKQMLEGFTGQEYSFKKYKYVDSQKLKEIMDLYDGGLSMNSIKKSYHIGKKLEKAMMQEFEKQGREKKLVGKYYRWVKKVSNNEF